MNAYNFSFYHQIPKAQVDEYLLVIGRWKFLKRTKEIGGGWQRTSVLLNGSDEVVQLVQQPEFLGFLKALYGPLWYIHLEHGHTTKATEQHVTVTSVGGNHAHWPDGSPITT